MPVRLPGVPEAPRREFRCPVVASAGVCKTHWLKTTSNLLMWVIKRKIAFGFYLLDSLFPTHLKSASTSVWLCLADSRVGECALITVVVAHAVIFLSFPF